MNLAYKFNLLGYCAKVAVPGKGLKIDAVIIAKIIIIICFKKPCKLLVKLILINIFVIKAIETIVGI